MDIIKVSVVLPCYNVEKYIRRGLDAILAQSLQEWEAILVDDGATDSTGSICDEYAKRDKRFRVMHQENGGVSRARNAGMADAQGELLYFMDPDDWIEPNCFERCYEVYREYECDIVNFAFWWVYGDNKFTANNNSFSIFKGNEIYEEYTKQLAGFGQNALNKYYNGEFIWNHKKNGHLWSYMLKTKFVLKHNLHFCQDLVMYEDALFMVEATYKCKEIVRIPDVLYYYCMRVDSAVNMKKDALWVYGYKYKQIDERQRLRNEIKEFDLHDSYLVTNVFSCLQLALQTSDKWNNYVLYRKFVIHPNVQESIKKIKMGFKPLKITIPVTMLKIRCHSLLFLGCWIMNKLGVAKRINM